MTSDAACPHSFRPGPAQRQAQPDADRLGREERFEHPFQVFGVDARAVVRQADFDAAVERACGRSAGMRVTTRMPGGCSTRLSVVSMRSATGQAMGSEARPRANSSSAVIVELARSIYSWMISKWRASCPSNRRAAVMFG